MNLINKNIIELNNIHTELGFNLEFSELENEHFIDRELYEKLDKYKNMIDKLNNHRAWDFCKKLSNECELLHFTLKNKSQNIGIANYDPISRAFFKMWEILHDFNLIDLNKNTLVYGALAEGPGGFIECFNYFRRKYNKTNLEINDVIRCITLKSDNLNIPGWKKSNRILNECFNCEISYGADGTGDLYNKNNILAYSELFKNNKANLVTADGGFDFSDNFSNQEINAFQLIYCEIITGLSILDINGNMVIKIFDLMHSSSVDLIYIICKYFDKIIISKPFSSRTANSEKYLICKGFKGINDNDLNGLLNIVDELNILKSQNKEIKRILNNEIPYDFLDIIHSLNIYFVSRQIKGILKVISLTSLNLSNDDLNEIKKEQTVYALSWCKKYDFPINLRCRYLKCDNQYNFIPNF